MANLLFDGFEQLTVGYSRLKWDISASSGNVTTSNVRPGGSTQKVTGSGTGTWIRSIGSNVGHVFAGWGFLNTASISANASCEGILYDGATAQVGWRQNSDGSISVYRGADNTATLIGTTAATGLLPASGVAADFKMVELEVVFATGATGTVKLRVAGVEELSVTSVQTSNTANSYCNRIGIFMTNASGTGLSFDDVYVNDDTGSAPHNTYYGEAFVVEKVIPGGNGNSSQWLGSDGNNTDNYLLVDDSGNDDTDYNAEATVNEIDTYAGTNLTNATGTIIGVEQIFIARKDDVATREIAGVLRTGSTDYPQTTRTMTGAYQLFSERIDVNPNTTLAWSIADINGIEIGQKVIT